MSHFINLHTNTEYSILESSIKIDDLIEFAIKNNLKKLVITDHNNMFGVPEFIKKTKERNIQPIIGLDLDVEDYRMILLSKNYEGYLHLLQLSSQKMNGNNISLSDIDPENIFIIDHPRLGCYYVHNYQPKIKNYYLGLSNGTNPNGVAIHETRTLYPYESNILPILENIKTGKKIEDIKVIDYSFKLDSPLEYSMTRESERILEKCNVIFPKYENQLPKFDSNTNSHIHLKKWLLKSLKVLFKKYPNLNNDEYIKRCNHELEVIKSLKYDDYFLIIADIINWAKQNKIMIGPGRGSSSGSLVSYLLNITEIDPIKYNLLFERFLNVKRVSMPDIDIDIQDDRRNEVVDYVFRKYGSKHVAQIVTFSILGPKSALRDAARALQISSISVDQITKLVTYSKKYTITTLDDIYKNIPSFRALVDNNQQYKKLFEYAKLIEGLPRQTGTHAAGIVLSASPLTNIVPTMKSVDNIVQTQFSMEYLESHGLFKIDLLGLKNLTIIKNIQSEIYKSYKRKVKLSKIDFNDAKTNKLFSEANTNGIFQFESWGMKNALKKIQVNSLDDVIAIIALYRPGPMKFIDEYADRKNKLRVISYVHNSLEAVLKPTYGIIIFQEQIMQIVQVYAGMSLAQADIFRRAISKKNAHKLNEQKKLFFEMSLKNKRDSIITKKVWELIYKFANYGFAKSHAVAYSIIAYWMAFFKSHFPIEFYIPLLNNSIGSTSATENYINEIKNSDLEIIPPSINYSHKTYHNKNGKIVMPLITLKGLGLVINNKIIDERINNGKYTSFLDFIIRSYKNGISTLILEVIIKANVLAEFGNVNSLLLSLPPALRFAKMVIIKKDNMVYIDDTIISKPLLILAKRNILDEVKFQKYYFGFPVSTFLTDTSKYPMKLKDLKLNKELKIVAQVKSVKKILTKDDKKEMAFIKIFDSTKSIEVIVMPNVFKFVPKVTRDDIYLFSIIITNYKNKKTYLVNKMKKMKIEYEK